MVNRILKILLQFDEIILEIPKNLPKIVMLRNVMDISNWGAFFGT